MWLDLIILIIRRPPRSTRTDTLLPYTTLFRSNLVQFAQGHDTLLIVEEKKSFLEAQTATALVNFPQAPRLIGKSDEDGRPLLSSVVPLDPSAIAQVIAERLRRLDVATASFEAASTSLISALARSEDRRVGKACVNTCSSRESAYHKKKNPKRE